jgi:membrane fusion protein (multidrug efflux system)
VPLTAVRRATYGQYVFVLGNEQGKLRAHQKIVRTGPVQGNDIVVLDGVAEGDLIAAAGSFKLREGMLVRIAEAAETQTPTN